MFFQLSEIRKQQALTQNLEQSKQKTHEILIGSYSFNKKVQKPLRERFGLILNQSALHIHNLREIQESVKYKCLLPSIFNDKELNKLIYNRGNLPQWFQHVFQKEYQKEKINIEIISLKFYKLHGLGQKFIKLEKEHQNIQNIYSRYESLNDKQLEKLDIIEEMNSFQNFYKSCKQIYKNFLFLITKKVLQFLQKTIESTLNYSNQLRKVKSSQNLQYTQTNIYPQSPNIYLQKKNMIDTTILKAKNSKHINKIQDCYPSNVNQTKGRLQNNSTVQSLRQKEKENNEFFFRKALLKDKSNQTFQTQQLKSYRSQHTSRYQSPIGISKFRQTQNSRDSLKRKQRNFYQESLAFKDSSILRGAKSIDETQLQQKNFKSPAKSYKQKTLQKLSIQKVQDSCFHHCPHHDKILNNHCSKHCEKMCSHEKKYFNDFGLDLTKMDRQFYQSKYQANQQHQLKTYRSSNLNRSNGQFLSPQFKESSYVSKMKRNDIPNVSYLRTSHEKHHNNVLQNKDTSQSRYKNIYSPLRQNIEYSSRLMNIENYSKHNNPHNRNQSPLSHIRYKPQLSYRSQYYC